MGLVQGITTGITAKNASKDQARANNELTRRMELSRQAYQQRRPQVAQERQAALQSQLGVYNPVAGMMGEMTGGKYAPNVQALGQGFPVKPKATDADMTANDQYRRSVSGIPGQDASVIPGVTADGIEASLARQGYDVSGIRSEGDREREQSERRRRNREQRKGRK